MRTRVSAALCAALAVAALTSGLVVGSSAATAATVETTVSCRTYENDRGSGKKPQNWIDVFTLTQSPASPEIGDVVTVTLDVADGPPAPRRARSGSRTLLADVRLLGAVESQILLSSEGDYPSSRVKKGEPLGGVVLSGAYLASGAGPITLVVRQLHLQDDRRATELYCSDTGDRDHRNAPLSTDIKLDALIRGPSVTVTAVEGQRPGTTSYARPGDTLSLSVTRFPTAAAAGSVTARLCEVREPDDCDPLTPTTVTIGPDGSGSGLLALPVGTTAGERVLRLASGSVEAKTFLTILGIRSATVEPVASTLPTSVVVMGSSYDPSATVTVQGMSGAVPSSDAGALVRARSDGSFAVTVTVNDPSTTGFQILEVDGEAGDDNGPLVVPFSVLVQSCTVPDPADGSVSCFTTQRITTQVRMGMLRSVRNGDRVQVTDTRGGLMGWTMSATVDADRIDAAYHRLRITPACSAAGADSAPGAQPGPPAQSLVSTVTLCVKDQSAGTSGSSGGVWAVSGRVVSVPDAKGKTRRIQELTLTMLLA